MMMLVTVMMMMMMMMMVMIGNEVVKSNDGDDWLIVLHWFTRWRLPTRKMNICIFSEFIIFIIIIIIIANILIKITKQSWNCRNVWN